MIKLVTMVHEIGTEIHSVYCMKPHNIKGTAVPVSAIQGNPALRIPLKCGHHVQNAISIDLRTVRPPDTFHG